MPTADTPTEAPEVTPDDRKIADRANAIWAEQAAGPSAAAIAAALARLTSASPMQSGLVGLGFRIEERSGMAVVVEDDGGVGTPSWRELAMWQRLAEQSASQSPPAAPGEGWCNYADCARSGAK